MVREGFSLRAFILFTVLIACIIMTTAQAEKSSAKHCVVVWSEGTAPKNIYPKDICGAVAEGLKELKDWEVVEARITDPNQGMPDELLNRTDVLIWWGHRRHEQVSNALVDKIYNRVKDNGMGFIALHSSHFAKPYKKLMGTPCSWKQYITDSNTLKVVVKDANHPIAKGVSEFTIIHDERYSEPFAVNAPTSVVFEGTYTLNNGGTDTSRQGLVWEVGKGRVFYFQPGHETNPVFFDPNIRRIMRNAVEWASPR
jgi:trehalose utilization protein